MRHRANTVIRIALGVTMLFECLVHDASADQVGIDKVRLVEETAGQYVLELDTSPRFLGLYRTPVLPERFEWTDVKREREPGFIVLRYRFRTLGEPLNRDDELLLPWERSGAAITARWSDGSVHQNLFLRDFEGIRVPLRMLRPSESSLAERALRHLQMGLMHGCLSWNHWLLIVALGLFARGWWPIGLVLCVAAGQAVALVLAELGAFVVPAEVAELCVVLVALLVARAAPLAAAQSRRFAAVMVILGLLHGLGVAKMLRGTDAAGVELVQGLLMFNLGIDVVAVAGVSACVLAVWVARQGAGQVHVKGSPPKGAPVVAASMSAIVRTAVGGAAFAGLLIALVDGTHSWPSAISERRPIGPSELPAAQLSITRGRPSPARALTGPASCFLTVEPFQVRLEVLLQVNEAGLRIDSSNGQMIEVQQQQAAKQQVIDLISDTTSVQIDGNDAQPALRRADFVTVEPNGIFSRAIPVPEPLDGAIVGVTFVYDTVAMANELQFEWKQFSPAISRVPTTTTDPFGGKQQTLSPDHARLIWKNRWLGYQPPEVKPVAVTKPRLPLFSALLAAVAGSSCWILVRGGRRRLAISVAAALLTAAFILYPFARVSMAAPFLGNWKPSPEQAADILDRLLTNVYRAYDIRDEGAIYDRLERTITGEQLTEIYLATRRSLELENRGGARARVDEVEIVAVHSVDSASNDGYAVDLSWTVSGSVTHFGHTHYRRNRYRAIVTLLPSNGHWKICSIDIGEQQRIL